MTGPISSAGVSISGGRQREHRVEPEKEEIGARCGLNDRGIRPAGRAEGTEDGGDDGEREKDAAAEEQIFPDRAGNEGHAVFVRQLVILLHVGGVANDATGHGPFVDSQFQHHQQMQADERDEQPGNDEDMQREKARQRCAGDDRAAQQQVDQPRAQRRERGCRSKRRCPSPQ